MDLQPPAIISSANHYKFIHATAASQTIISFGLLSPPLMLPPPLSSSMQLRHHKPLPMLLTLIRPPVATANAATAAPSESSSSGVAAAAQTANRNVAQMMNSKNYRLYVDCMAFPLAFTIRCYSFRNARIVLSRIVSHVSLLLWHLRLTRLKLKQTMIILVCVRSTESTVPPNVVSNR